VDYNDLAVRGFQAAVRVGPYGSAPTIVFNALEVLRKFGKVPEKAR
jgi:hypothetical protein